MLLFGKKDMIHEREKGNKNDHNCPWIIVPFSRTVENTDVWVAWVKQLKYKGSGCEDNLQSWFIWAISQDGSVRGVSLESLPSLTLSKTKRIGIYIILSFMKIH